MAPLTHYKYNHSKLCLTIDSHTEVNIPVQLINAQVYYHTILCTQFGCDIVESMMMEELTSVLIRKELPEYEVERSRVPCSGRIMSHMVFISYF